MRRSSILVLWALLGPTAALAQNAPHAGADLHNPRGNVMDAHPVGAVPGGAHDAHDAHGGSAHGKGHPAHHEHDEKAAPGPMNWWHGLLGTKEDVEPNLLWRAPEEPAPFLASLINFGILVFVLVRFGKKPLADALVKRKETILREISEAQRLKSEAEKRLAEYEHKIAAMGSELDQLRQEFREQGEKEKERIVREANETRARMRRDAEALLQQEMKQLRLDLTQETVDEALRLTTDLLAKRITPADHDRFAEGFLAELPRQASSSARAAGTSRGELS